jgi:hypothetical protein
VRRFRSLNHYFQAGLLWALAVVRTPEWAYFATYGPTLVCPYTLWPYSGTVDCSVADLFVYIGLMLLLFTSKPGTESAVELRSGPTTELGVTS